MSSTYFATYPYISYLIWDGRDVTPFQLQLSNRMAVLGFIGCGQAGPCRGNVAMCWHQIQKQHWWQGIYIYFIWQDYDILFTFARSWIFGIWKSQAKFIFNKLLPWFLTLICWNLNGFAWSNLIRQFFHRCKVESLNGTGKTSGQSLRASGILRTFFFVPRGPWIWIFFLGRPPVIGKTFGPTYQPPTFSHKALQEAQRRSCSSGLGLEDKSVPILWHATTFCRFSRWKWHEHFWQAGVAENNLSTASTVSIFSCLPNVVASFDPWEQWHSYESHLYTTNNSYCENEAVLFFEFNLRKHIPSMRTNISDQM